mmetsp:Transcript_19622/g.56255  ORF Transcript_19622/g.56255 Transcript_19622/m.56255 type:complete len:296 (+) Transcript_19622:276-1163(+)
MSCVCNSPPCSACRPHINEMSSVCPSVSQPHTISLLQATFGHSVWTARLQELPLLLLPLRSRTSTSAALAPLAQQLLEVPHQPLLLVIGGRPVALAHLRRPHPLGELHDILLVKGRLPSIALPHLVPHCRGRCALEGCQVQQDGRAPLRRDAPHGEHEGYGPHDGLEQQEGRRRQLRQHHTGAAHVAPHTPTTSTPLTVESHTQRVLKVFGVSVGLVARHTHGVLEVLALDNPLVARAPAPRPHQTPVASLESLLQLPHQHIVAQHMSGERRPVALGRHHAGPLFDEAGALGRHA